MSKSTWIKKLLASIALGLPHLTVLKMANTYFDYHYLCLKTLLVGEPWLPFIIQENSMLWADVSVTDSDARLCCTQHLYLSTVVWVNNTRALTFSFFRFSRSLGLILSVFPSGLIEVLEGVDSLAVQARQAPLCCLARGRGLVEREREVTDMIIPECQYKKGDVRKVPAELENE